MVSVTYTLEGEGDRTPEEERQNIRNQLSRKYQGEQSPDLQALQDISREFRLDKFRPHVINSKNNKKCDDNNYNYLP